MTPVNYLLAVTKITVLTTHGTDLVVVDTTLPTPYPPEVSDQPLSLKFDVTKGRGVDYVKDNFHIEPEVIDTT